MRRNFILVILSFVLVQSHAQTLGFGIKGGLNFSELSNNLPLYSGTAGATGFVGGVWARAGILGFFVQPEILISQRKGALTSTIDQTAVINTLTYVDAPVLVGYKFLMARVNFGPNFLALTGASQNATDAAKDPNFSKDNYVSGAVGFVAGVGADVGKLSVDLRYDGGFPNLGKAIPVNGSIYNYETHAKMWQLTVGYRIF